MLRGRRDTPWAGDGLVFLVGHPRSGTTFLGRLLGAHPKVGYWEEPAVLQFVDRVHAELRRLQRHLQLDAQLDTFTLKEVGNTRKQHALDDSDVRRADERSVARTRELVEKLVDDFRSLSRRPLVVEKTPMGVGLLPVLQDVLPDAKAIHIVRDPRDLVASIHRMAPFKGRPGWLRGPEADVATALATQWRDLVARAIEVELVLGPSTVHRLRHEDLVAQPDRELRSLFGFLRIDWTTDIDEFLASGHSGGLDPARSGNWHDEVSPDEAAVVADVAGDLMQSLGYSTDETARPC